jgi:hypothetical protein
MLKNMKTKVLACVACVSMVCSISLPVFASTTSQDTTTKLSSNKKESSKFDDYKINLGDKTYSISELKEMNYSAADDSKLIKNSLTATTTSNTSSLNDGTPISGTFTGVQTFNINVQDFDARQIMQLASVPVKITLTANGLSQVGTFDSGMEMTPSYIGWNFVPGLNYTLTVYPLAGIGTYSLTLMMNKNSSYRSWVYVPNIKDITGNNIVEKKMIMGQDTDEYGLKFKEGGTYKVRIEASGYIDVNVYGTESNGQNYSSFQRTTSSSIIEFTINPKAVQSNESFTHYIKLNDTNDKLGSGCSYTISIVKIS